MINIGVAGAAGRMGKAIVTALDQNEKARVSAAIEHASAPEVGSDAGVVAGIGDIGVTIGSSPADSDFDVLIDFTRVEATLANLAFCTSNDRKMVIGTTGFTEDQRSEIDAAGTETSIMIAPNMSVGVNLCFYLLETAAGVLGDRVDVEVIEAHHRDKIDAPSGTAMRMGEIIASALGRDIAKSAVYGRQGIGEPRNRETIGFSSIRAGDIVGDHTVLFASEGERIEITHRAGSRSTFAEGAVRAATWLYDKPSGIYDMQDVLGLR
jgi:4-hydroxy-tetrahydrodipicolinate reductase